MKKEDIERIIAKRKDNISEVKEHWNHHTKFMELDELNDFINFIHDEEIIIECLEKCLAKTHELAKEIAEKALDEYVYEGKTIRQWVDEIIANNARWIPCSEMTPQKPEENPLFENKTLELYLVSIKNIEYPFRAFWNGKFFSDGWNKVNAIAWMPLPKPYIPESKHEQTASDEHWKERVMNTFLGERM